MFAKKSIKTSIALAEGNFSDGSNEVTLPQVPIKVSVDKAGGTDLPKCTVEVQNLSLDLMQRLTVLAFRQLQTYKNVIKIEVGEEGQTGDLLFQGEISSAVPSFDESGNVTFKIEALSGFYPVQQSKPPVSVQGETEIVKLFEQFAKEADYTLENNGVTGSVRNCVFTGTPIIKARQLARQTGVDLVIDNQKFVIMPSYTETREGYVPLLSKDTGLLKYPAFTNDGIQCTCLYNPLIQIAGMVKIQSIVPKASGVWRVNKLHYDLEAYSSNAGEWSMQIDGAWLNET